mmetsp:Transcript_89650/g.240492  ORF Transcript_89650/g.240492 Transcript_89650/m.240492 type:complete len:210 (-) Transcript_89650:63-692(-)
MLLLQQVVLVGQGELPGEIVHVRGAVDRGAADQKLGRGQNFPLLLLLSLQHVFTLAPRQQHLGQPVKCLRHSHELALVARQDEDDVPFDHVPIRGVDFQLSVEKDSEGDALGLAEHRPHKSSPGQPHKPGCHHQPIDLRRAPGDVLLQPRRLVPNLGRLLAAPRVRGVGVQNVTQQGEVPARPAAMPEQVHLDLICGKARLAPDPRIAS